MAGHIVRPSQNLIISPALPPIVQWIPRKICSNIETWFENIRSSRQVTYSSCIQVLFEYRASPHATTSRSPSQLFLGRPLRTRFDLLRPNVSSQVLDE